VFEDEVAHPNSSIRDADLWPHVAPLEAGGQINPNDPSDYSRMDTDWWKVLAFKGNHSVDLMIPSGASIVINMMAWEAGGALDMLDHAYVTCPWSTFPDPGWCGFRRQFSNDSASLANGDYYVAITPWYVDGSTPQYAFSADSDLLIPPN
jgi:hypothetical protein